MGDVSEQIRGAAAIREMLDLIGCAGGDRDVAQVLCDNEMAIRALLARAMKDLADD